MAPRHALDAGHPGIDCLRQVVESDARPATLLVWGPAAYALKDRDRCFSRSAPRPGQWQERSGY